MVTKEESIDELKQNEPTVFMPRSETAIFEKKVILNTNDPFLCKNSDMKNFPCNLQLNKQN